MASEILTIQQLSQALSVPVGTIYYWVSRREIPFVKYGRHLRFDLAEVMQFFREKTVIQQEPCTPVGAKVCSPSRSLKTKEASQFSLPKKGD